jgi:hypothetical protein
MAAGSQAENGIWALLVLIVENNKNKNIGENKKLFIENVMKFQDPYVEKRQIIKIIPISPRRLVIAVIIPEFREYLL